MLDKLREGLLFQLAKTLYKRNLGQSEEMTAALEDREAYESYRAECVDKIREAAHRLSVPVSQRDVLDLGCYDGALTSSLKTFDPASLTGIDIDADAIETANIKFAGPDVEFRVSGTDRLPLADESIDTIISYDVFEHVETPAQILSECYRVLRPGGSMLIGTWGWYHPFAPHLWSVMPVPWAHVLFSERIMLRVCRRIYQTDWYQPNMHDFDKNGERIPDKFNYESIPTDYLNKFLIRDFERIFQQSEFDFQIHPERFSSRAAAWTKPLLRVPVLKEFFTSYIWCVLSKPGNVRQTPSPRISTAPERPVPQPSSCP